MSVNTSLLVFPCHFPIKVMGDNVEGFAQNLITLAQQFDPQLEAAQVEIRTSAKGNYLSVTLPIYATSQAQLDDLYRALQAQPSVRMVL